MADPERKTPPRKSRSPSLFHRTFFGSSSPYNSFDLDKNSEVALQLEKMSHAGPKGFAGANPAPPASPICLFNAAHTGGQASMFPMQPLSAILRSDTIDWSKEVASRKYDPSAPMQEPTKIEKTQLVVPKKLAELGPGLTMALEDAHDALGLFWSGAKGRFPDDRNEVKNMILESNKIYHEMVQKLKDNGIYHPVESFSRSVMPETSANIIAASREKFKAFRGGGGDARTLYSIMVNLQGQLDMALNLYPTSSESVEKDKQKEWKQPELAPHYGIEPVIGHFDMALNLYPTSSESVGKGEEKKWVQPELAPRYGIEPVI